MGRDIDDSKSYSFRKEAFTSERWDVHKNINFLNLFLGKAFRYWLENKCFPGGSSRSPKLFKGVLIEISEPFFA